MNCSSPMPASWTTVSAIAGLDGSPQQSAGAALSIQERLALIDDLWEVLDPPPLEASIAAAHRQMIEERLANYDPESENLLTVNDVCPGKCEPGFPKDRI